MKKKTTVFVVLAIIILCVVTAMYFNPNLNVFKLKRVENNALEYIHQTYPEFEVVNISAKHDWKSNWYIVDYNDGNGNSGRVFFDQTGENLYLDEYMRNKARDIIYDYEYDIELKIKYALENELSIDVYYIDAEDEIAREKEREIVLDGLDISADPVKCNVGITGDDNSTLQDFAELSKDIYLTISDLGLPVESLEIHQQNSPESRFDIACPENMGEMSIEEIKKLVRN